MSGSIRWLAGAAMLWILAYQTSQAQEPPPAQARQFGLTLQIQGTDRADTFTVNDSEGVIITSAGMKVTVVGRGELEGPKTLEAADPRGPTSAKGFLVWSYDGSGDNYYTGKFGGGADRYIRIDGSGNDRYEYDAGPGADVITSTDGPGNDEYIYINGPGNDQSAHDNSARGSGGNDVYWIDAGPGTDRISISGDGLGDDSYTYINAESLEITDYFKGDQDRFAIVRDDRQDEGR